MIAGMAAAGQQGRPDALRAQQVTGAERGGEPTSLRYWRPDPALAPYVSGYHDYLLDLPGGQRRQDVFFPAWTNIRFAFDAEPWSVRIGHRQFVMPANILCGPTSHASYVDAGAGRLVGAGLTPRGWAVLVGGDLSQYADRIADPSRALADVGELRRALAGSTNVKAEFDAYFGERLRRAAPEDLLVGQLHTLIANPGIRRVGELAERLGINNGQLTRLSKRNFGFTPKLLLRRARFLRVLDALEDSARGSWAEIAAEAGYWDMPHFVHDAQHFLGCSVGEFLRMPRPMSRRSREARSRVLGASMQSLQPPVRSGTKPLL